MPARRRLLFKTIATTVVLLLLSAMPSLRVERIAAAAPANLWTPNGSVGALAAVGDTLYVGGAFNYLGPTTGSFATVQTSSGQGGPSLPAVEGAVKVAVPDTNGGWYIGGSFTAVGGAARHGLAHILPNGALDATWSPSVGGYALRNIAIEVRALAVSNSKVYVGGTFARINDKLRDGLAAFDAISGALLDWAPLAGTIDYTIFDPPSANALLLSPDATRLYVSGNFAPTSSGSFSLNVFRTADDTLQDQWPVSFDEMALSANGAILYGREYKTVRALDAASGAEKWQVAAGGDDKTILNAMALSSDMLYVGGVFQQLGSASRTNIGAINAATGKVLPWAPAFDRFVYALAADAAGVYVGTDLRAFDYNGIFKAPRTGIIKAFDPTSGASLWSDLFGGQNPIITLLKAHNDGLFVAGDFYSVGGVERNGVAAIDIRTGAATPWAPKLDQRAIVNAVVANERAVYVGGSFTLSADGANNCLAAFDASAGSLLDWKPAIDTVYCGVQALVLDDSTLFVGGSFSAIGSQRPQPARYGLAALDATTAAANEWDPGAYPYEFDSGVRAMVLSGDTLYVGGGFSRISGELSLGLAALDKSTGKAKQAFPHLSPITHDYISALAFDGKSGLLTVGGSFSALGEQQRAGLGQIDVNTNSVTNWNPNPQDVASPDGPSVSSLVSFGPVVFVGGQFQQVGSPMVQSQNFAALDSVTGAVAASPAQPNGVVSKLLAHAGKIYVGGGFTTINGQLHPYITAIDLPQMANANPPTAITTTSATLRGSADVGTDQASASFELTTTSGNYTNARVVPATPVTITGTATVSATVTGLAPGTNYFYRLVVTGPSGITRSPEQQFATPTNPLPPLPSKVFLPLVSRGP